MIPLSIVVFFLEDPTNEQRCLSMEVKEVPKIGEIFTIPELAISGKITCVAEKDILRDGSLIMLQVHKDVFCKIQPRLPQEIVRL